MKYEDTNICCYRIQSLKRQAKGEQDLGKLIECLHCFGYDRKCEDYVSIKQMVVRN